MAAILLRYGLWVLALVLGLYVLREALAEQPIAEFISQNILNLVLLLGVVLVAASAVVWIIEKIIGKTTQSRCVVCRQVVPHGEIYCRRHLREILAEEDDRTHNTAIRGGRR